MSSIISQNNKGTVVALVFVLMSVLRLPAELQYSRDAIRVVTETGVMIALGLFIIQKGNKWVGLFAILAVFSSFYPVVGKSAYFTRNCIFYGLVWYMIVVSTFNKDTIKYLMYGMSGVAFIHILFLVWQYFGLDPYRMFTFGLMETATISSPTGLMTNKNEASGLLALTAPAFLVNRRLMLGLVLVAVGLIIANSAGGVVAAGAGLIFYLIFSGFPLLLVVGCVGVVIVSAVLYLKFCNVPGIAARWEIWANGWGYYKEHWVMGYGLGHWKMVTKQRHAHNDIYQVLFEMGIGAGVLMIGYIVGVFRRFTKKALIPTTALIVIVVHSCYSWLWHIGTTAMVSVTWLAVLEILLNDCNDVAGNFGEVTT